MGQGEVSVVDNAFFGICGTGLCDATAVRLGRAFAALLAGGSDKERAGRVRVAVGFDARPPSADLHNSLVRGIASAGVHVVSLGHAPSPLVLFSMVQLKLDGAAIVSGSHLPHRWNGIRLYAGGAPLGRTRMRELERRAREMPHVDLLPLSGGVTYLNMAPDYLRYLEREFGRAGRLQSGRSARVVVAANHGVASLTAPYALTRAGCKVVRFGCAMRGGEKRPPPDPGDPVLLREAGSVVRAASADFGIVFDGDGDRIRAVDAEGSAIPADHLFALFAANVAEAAGRAEIACDVRVSDVVDECVEERGGSVTLVPPGHAALAAAVRPGGALFGGEREGNYYFADRYFGFDDGTYAALRLVEIFAGAQKARRPRIALREILPAPERYRAPERVIPARGNHGTLSRFESLLRQRLAAEGGAALVDVTPGFAVRLRTREGWGLFYRSPADGDLHLVYEGKSEEGFHATGALLRDILARAAAEKEAAHEVELSLR